MRITRYLSAVSIAISIAIGGTIAYSADDLQPIEIVDLQREEPVSYFDEIIDILDAKCIGCHNAALMEKGFNMEEVADMIAGGISGPALVPGKAEESLMFLLASHRRDPVMPPKDKKGDPMTPEELGLLKLWIDQGAIDDSLEEPATETMIELGTLPAGVQPIIAVDLTAQGDRAAAGRANAVQVYDVTSGLEILSLGGHQDLIQSLRYSPDGKRLAAGSYRIVTVWDVPSGQLHKSFEGHGEPVQALASGPEGKTIVTGGLDRTIRVWDVAEGTETAKIDQPKNSQVLALSVSSDGSQVAAGGSDGIVRVWNLESKELVNELSGHEGPITGVAFLPVGDRLASTSEDGTARLWTLAVEPDEEAENKDKDKDEAEDKDEEAEAGAESFKVLSGHEGPVRALAIPPDGDWIFTAGVDGKVIAWKVEDGQAGQTFQAHDAAIQALAVDPEGQILLTGSVDTTARLFDIASGDLIRTLTGHPSPLQAVAFGPEGDRIATADANGGLKVWETESGNGVIAFGHASPNELATQPIHALAFLEGGRLASASADKSVKTWDFEGNWNLHKTLEPHNFRVLALDFSPDGKVLATGAGEPSRSGEIKLWEVESGALLRTLDEVHSDTVFGLRFSPDGSKLASGAADRFLKVIEVETGKVIRTFEGHTHHVMAVDWKEDGKQLASGGADNVLKIWDFEAGEQLRTSQEAGNQITALRWVANKPTIHGASGDRVVRSWNTENGRIGTTFSGPSDYVFGLATSADGSLITAGGADSTLFFWKEDGKVVRQIGPPVAAEKP